MSDAVTSKNIEFPSGSISVCVWGGGVRYQSKHDGDNMIQNSKVHITY